MKSRYNTPTMKLRTMRPHLLSAVSGPDGNETLSQGNVVTNNWIDDD